MKRTLIRLLDVSMLAGIPAGLANSAGYHNAALVLIGVGIGLAVSVLACAMRAAYLRSGRLIEVDEEAGVVLIEFTHNGRTCRRWHHIAEVLGR
jgi:hypothetical protein